MTGTQTDTLPCPRCEGAGKLQMDWDPFPRMCRVCWGDGKVDRDMWRDLKEYAEHD